VTALPLLAADLMSHVTNSDELHFGPWHFGIPGVNKHVTMMLLAALVVGAAAIATARAAVRAQGRGLLANCVEATCLFLRNEVVRPGIGDHHASAWFPLFATFFFFILVNNLLGLLPPPLGATATGNIWVTASLAVVTLAAMFGGGMKEKGVFGFWLSLIPHGVPLALKPLVWAIEFFGLFVKPFALTVRLFANMTAGHVILAVLGSFLIAGSEGFFTGKLGAAGWLGLKAGVGLPTLGFALFIMVFEVLVAFIQAYIFTTLSAIFVGQCLSHEH
jgi:F-type H+-transporting ATPase subunit a